MNDGSTDETGDVIRQIKQITPLDIVDLTTSGLGSGPARNLGMEAVSPGWLAFLDVDDAFEAGALGAWVQSASHFGCDVLLPRSPVGLSIRRRRRMPPEPSILTPPMCKSAELLRDWLPGGKLYRTEFVQRTGCFYSDSPEGQDVPFSTCALVRADVIGVDPHAPRYIYRAPTNTAAHRPPRDPAGTIHEFQKAISQVVILAPSTRDARRTSSPLLAGASAALLRGLGHAESSEQRDLLKQALLGGPASVALTPSGLVALDPRDRTICAAAAAAVRGPDAVARAIGWAWVKAQARRYGRRPN